MPTLPAQVVTNPPQGWELKQSGKAPRGRAEWSLVPVQMVLCAGSGTVSVWLRSQGRMLEAVTPPTPSIAGYQGRLHSLRGRYSLGVWPWDRGIPLRFPKSSPEHPSPPQWHLLSCPSTGYRTTRSLMSLCTSLLLMPLDAEPLTVCFNRELKHAWRDLNIDDPPLRIHPDDSQRQTWSVSPKHCHHCCVHWLLIEGLTGTLLLCFQKPLKLHKT